jgi:hypothetical protein
MLGGLFLSAYLQHIPKLHIMKIHLFFLFSFWWVLPSQAQKKDKSSSQINQYFAAPAQIDGQLTEWEHPLLRPSTQYGIQAKMGNDQQFVYVSVRITDQGLQQLVMAHGLTIYLDTLGKKRSKPLGIGYPLPLTNEQVQYIGNQFSTQDPKAIERAYAEVSQEFDIINLVDEVVRLGNLGSKDIKVQLGFDELQALQIEYRIPLAQVWKRKLTFNEELRLLVKINEAPRKAEESDSGLFNDNSQMGNGITQTNPLLGPGANNPNGMNNPLNPMSRANAQPNFRANSQMPSIALRSKLSPKP